MTFAEVLLWGTKIGTVALPDDSHIATFRYDRDFLSSGIELSPITMPLSTRQYSFAGLPYETFHGLPGLLADSLPDRFGNTVIDQWLARQGRTPSSFNAVERLCYTGKRGMGALEFKPVLGPGYDKNEQIKVNELVRLSSDILNKRTDMHITADDTAMRQILQIGTSAGGARAKAIIAWNPKTNDIRSGQIEAGQGYEYWLIKFDGVSKNGDHDLKDPPVYTRIEYAYYLMARAAGINMNECRLFEENGLYHFMTKRFDREDGTGRKLHMQTLGAIAHYDYNEPTAYSYEMAASVLRKMKLPQSDMEQLCLRMIFNVLTKNNDDHVKNISFLMNRKGQWSLSPAYDLTLSYDPDNRWLKAHQMSVNGKRTDITEEDILACASVMDITPSKGKAMIERVKNAVADFPKFAKQAHLPDTAAVNVQKLISDEDIRMIGCPTMVQMFGENEEEALSDEAYARLWSDINETPKNRLLEELHSRYEQKRDISPFKDLLQRKMVKPNDAGIRKKVNDYINDEAKKAKINVSLTEDKSKTAEWWTTIKPRLIDSWYGGKKPDNNPKGRFALYKLSFALGLEWEEHCKLFSKIFRMKTYLRTPAEFCLTYCKKNRLSYAEAFNLYVQYCTKSEKTIADSPVDYQATRAIGENILSLKKSEEFLASITKNRDNYFINSITIRKNISSILGIGDRLIDNDDMGRIQDALRDVGYKLHDGEYDSDTKKEISELLRSEFYVSVESALNDSGRRRNNLQLRKIYILLKFREIIREENTSFVDFIRDIDDDLLSMNLPMLYYSDDFDRGIILAAAYITVCGGWGEFSDSEKLSGLITAIVIGSNR